MRLPSALKHAAEAASKATKKLAGRSSESGPVLSGLKKLPSVEAERVMGVVDMTMAKLDLIAAFHPKNPKVPELLQVLPEDLGNLARQHMALLAKGDRAGPDAVRDSTRTLVRLFLKDSAALSAVRQTCQGSCPAELQGFLGEMAQLRQIVFQKLLTTADEERRRLEHTSELSAREKKYNVEIRKLDSELAKEEEERQEEVGKLDVVIARLLRDLHAIDKASSELAHKVDKDARKREMLEEKGFSARKEDIDAQILALEKQYAEMKAENKEMEAQLRKRKVKLEAEVENWISKFDSDMGEKQAEMDEIQEMYEQEVAQLNELQERFNRLEVEYNVIMEERKQERERREAAESELQSMVKAAILIQSLWRAYKCRKAMKKAAKKKDKKGKKKK